MHKKRGTLKASGIFTHRERKIYEGSMRSAGAISGHFSGRQRCVTHDLPLEELVKSRGQASERTTTRPSIDSEHRERELNKKETERP